MYNNKREISNEPKDYKTKDKYHGVANGKHSSLVHSEVTLDGLFMP